jgi:integrase
MRGSIRRRGSSYTWYLDVPDPATGKRRQRSKGGFRTKKECQAALTEALAAPAHRNVRGALQTHRRELPRGRMATRDAAATSAPSTWLSYQRNLERHVIPALGDIELQRLTPAQLTAFYR